MAPSLPMALLGAGLVIGLYAMLPAFFLWNIHVAKTSGIGREVVDHVFPGVLVLAVVVLAILRRAQPDGLMLSAGVGVVLAGFWMVVTHVGLAKQMLHHQVPTAGAVYHCSTAVAVSVLGVAWVWRYRTAGAAAPEARPAAARRRP